MKLAPETITQIAATAYADPVIFCQTFLSHWFPSNMPWVHRGILAVLLRKTDFLIKYGEIDKIERHFVYKINPADARSPTLPLFTVYRENGVVTRIDLTLKRMTLLQMPRGFSKTTLCNACVLYLISYRDCHFPLYVSETGNHAKMQLGNVKRELESNELLRLVFGDKVPGRQAAEKWTEELIQTTDGIHVAARGRGGQVRGLVIDGQRPDRVIIDDLEDKESVSTSEQIRKTNKWFFSDLKPVISKLNPEASMVILGTLLHKDALLQVLQKDPEFTSIVFGAIDLDGQPLWAANMSLERIENEKASYALAGNLNEFYMEYMSQLRDERTAKFRQEFFRYDSSPQLVVKAICIDPAISDATAADSSTISVVGMGKNGRISVEDMWGKRGASPREQVNAYFDLIEEHDPQLFGVEAIAYQAALIHLLKEEMFRRKRYFEIVPIRHGTRKVDRILGVLQPRYASGYITHKRIFPELEKQLLDFGQGHDDYPDVVAMAITLLDPYAAQAASPDSDLAEDKYEPIEDMDEWEEVKDYATAP